MLIAYQKAISFPTKRMCELWSRIKRANRKIKQLFEMMEEEDALQDAKSSIFLKPLRDEIRFENVCFSYDTKKNPDKTALKGWILHFFFLTFLDITLSIPCGKTTALVGRSGGGKSTLVLLTMRFHDPTTGDILWDGVNLRDAVSKSLVRAIYLLFSLKSFCFFRKRRYVSCFKILVCLIER